MTADRADGRGPMGEPFTMTATTNHEGQATGRPRAEGRPSEQAGLPGRWRALTVSPAAAFIGTPIASACEIARSTMAVASLTRCSFPSCRARCIGD